MSKHGTKLLVFSDLDGSLLDHYDYEFQQALPVVRALEALHIPLILVSSKTCTEMLELRKTLDNEHPFIVENGAAIYIPQDYFPAKPEECKTLGKYWVCEMAPPRQCWLQELSTLEKDFPGQFETFHGAGIAGIVAITGLSESRAQAANERGYSEPVKWLGTPQAESEFVQRLRNAGATVARGGRFLAVSGDCDKGQALVWLRSRYGEVQPRDTLADLAIGDSDNDRAMLEAARTALVIKSPVHDFPQLDRDIGVLHSRDPGPTGWADGVCRWLATHGISI